MWVGPLTRKKVKRKGNSKREFSHNPYFFFSLFANQALGMISGTSGNNYGTLGKATALQPHCLGHILLCWVIFGKALIPSSITSLSLQALAKDGVCYGH